MKPRGNDEDSRRSQSEDKRPEKMTGRSKSLSAQDTSDPGESSSTVPFDLNSGIIEALSNPPAGFVSKHTFSKRDLRTSVSAFPWFAHCGEKVSLDLSMEISPIRSWSEAGRTCKTLQWENVELEAQNQLTTWLLLNHETVYQNWNQRVIAEKEEFLIPLIELRIVPLQIKHRLSPAVVNSVRWDLLGALMENSYLGTGHRAFFFLELLMVYEAGHFPCGWEGDWPEGRLLVF